MIKNFRMIKINEGIAAMVRLIANRTALELRNSSVIYFDLMNNDISMIIFVLHKHNILADVIRDNF